MAVALRKGSALAFVFGCEQLPRRPEQRRYTLTKRKCLAGPRLVGKAEGDEAVRPVETRVDVVSH